MFNTPSFNLILVELCPITAAIRVVPLNKISNHFFKSSDSLLLFFCASAIDNVTKKLKRDLKCARFERLFY